MLIFTFTLVKIFTSPTWKGVKYKERDSKNFLHPPYFLARFTLQLHLFCSAIPVYFVSQPTIWAMLECQDLFSCFRSFHVIFQKDIHYVQKVPHPCLNNHRHCCFQKMVLLHPATKQNRNFGINIFGIRVWRFFSFQKCGMSESHPTSMIHLDQK